MDKDNLFVLVHSPLVGPLTWTRVADQMRQRGLEVMVPTLADIPDSSKPFWQQHAESVAQALAHLPKDRPMVLAAHSGAGPLLPAIHEALAHPVDAYLFIDAGIPRNNASRLDLMKSEDPEWAAQFQAELEQGDSFPNWSFEDLQEVIPNKALRKQMIAEIRPRKLSFFTEPIPVCEGWPDAPCAYIQFSSAYEQPAGQARQAGWQTYRLEVGHFHMLVDAQAVTDLILKSVEEISL